MEHLADVPEPQTGRYITRNFGHCRLCHLDHYTLPLRTISSSLRASSLVNAKGLCFMDKWLCNRASTRRLVIFRRRNLFFQSETSKYRGQYLQSKTDAFHQALMN